MDLPIYYANPPHHRASLLVNINRLRKVTAEDRFYERQCYGTDTAERVAAYIRRDLTALNGMAGVW